MRWWFFNDDQNDGLSFRERGFELLILGSGCNACRSIEDEVVGVVVVRVKGVETGNS